MLPNFLVEVQVDVEVNQAKVIVEVTVAEEDCG